MEKKVACHRLEGNETVSKKEKGLGGQTRFHHDSPQFQMTRHLGRLLERGVKTGMTFSRVHRAGRGKEKIKGEGPSTNGVLLFLRIVRKVSSSARVRRLKKKRDVDSQERKSNNEVKRKRKRNGQDREHSHLNHSLGGRSLLGTPAQCGGIH